MIICPTEKEDFDNAITSAGYRKEDFDVRESETPMSAGGIEPITGTITVRNKQTGLERSYKAGHGSTWVAEFENDLRTGAFVRSK